MALREVPADLSTYSRTVRGFVVLEEAQAALADAAEGLGLACDYFRGLGEHELAHRLERLHDRACRERDLAAACFLEVPSDLP